MTVKVEQKHIGGMVAWTPGRYGSGPLEALDSEIEGIEVEIDDADAVIVGDQLLREGGSRPSYSGDDIAFHEEKLPIAKPDGQCASRDYVLTQPAEAAL